jgi:hypothetical protein
MSGRKRTRTANELKNAFTGLNLSGNKNVYQITSPNGEKSVLVNKSSLLRLVGRANVNHLLGKPFVFAKSNNYGRQPVRDPIYGVNLNAQRIKKVSLTPANVRQLRARAANEALNESVMKKARNNAKKRAEAMRAQEQRTRQRAAGGPVVYKVKWHETRGNTTTWGETWVNKNGEELWNSPEPAIRENNNNNNANINITAKWNRTTNNSMRFVDRITRYRSMKPAPRPGFFRRWFGI